MTRTKPFVSFTIEIYFCDMRMWLQRATLQIIIIMFFSF